MMFWWFCRLLISLDLDIQQHGHVVLRQSNTVKA